MNYEPSVEDVGHADVGDGLLAAVEGDVDGAHDRVVGLVLDGLAARGLAARGDVGVGRLVQRVRRRVMGHRHEVALHWISDAAGN